MNLPLDSVMLLSVVNTNLRDRYESLDAFCQAEDVNKEDLINRLKAIDYIYDPKKNQFK